MKVAIIGGGLTGKELFAYLHTHKAEIIDMKKSVIKHADIVELPPITETLAKSIQVDKAGYLFENDEEAGMLKRTIIVNTYNWLDSHDDVHLANTFAKSISERGTRSPHLHDHKFEIAAKVGTPLSYSERAIKWKALNVDKRGETMALFLESEVKRRLNEKVYEAYLNNEIDQHSVGMQYVKIELAMNDEDYEKEYKVWKEVIGLLGNPERANKQGYFWAVREAKLIETSAVLLGSNELTPTLGQKFEPLQSTQTIEPRKRTLDMDKVLASYNKSLK